MRPRSATPILLALVLLLSATPADAKGGVQELTLRYVGTRIDAHVTVEQTTQGKKRTILFDDVVQPGEEFDVEGEDRDGTLGPVLRIRVDGRMNAKIRTNCSLALAPGDAFGDFELVDAQESCDDEADSDEADSDSDSDDGADSDSDDGADSDSDDEADSDSDEADSDAGDQAPDCDECEGQVTELTLLYDGEQEAQVRVTQKIRGNEVAVFDDLVQPGEPFTFFGVNGKGTFGSKVLVYADDRFQGRIHTSCSAPIGPGLTLGDFEVVEGYSRHGDRLCPLEDGDGDGEDDETGCAACDGQATELTLRYLGDETVRVEVSQRVRGQDLVTFDELVDPGEPFTVFGAKKHGRLGSKIKVYVEGKLAARIHTSCSEPIGPGLVVGDFEVVDGASRHGGRMCPLPADDP